MNTTMLGLLAETPIHPGSGRAMGVVDLPVAREAATHYPVLVGSSLKGALKSKAKELSMDNAEKLFGQQDHAGQWLVSDARLLLLPVRSLTTSYRWATCPHLVERYRRDLARAGLNRDPGTPCVKPGEALTKGDEFIFLEERQFRIAADDNTLAALAKAIEPLALHEATRKRMHDRIAVLHDDDFSWFARYGLGVQARNQLECDTKKSQNLWYEETLPPDTLMYALIADRSQSESATLDDLFPETDPYLQTGGNETVGQGWFAVEPQRAGEPS